MFDSVKLIGEKQYEKAKRLFDSATLKVSGPIGAAHQYIDMSNIVLQTSNGTVSTCKPAMGYSFAAGTTDGEEIISPNLEVTIINKIRSWCIRFPAGDHKVHTLLEFGS
jgi:neutral ceramidase